MEIERLRVVFTEQDLNDLARKHFLRDVPVEDFEIHISEAGIAFKGVYQMFVPVSFEALWKPGVTNGKATARLESFRTMGMPANMLRGLIMNVIEDAAAKEPWLRVDDDMVQADLDGLLKKRGFEAKTRLSEIRCEPGRIVVEGGGG